MLPIQPGDVEDTYDDVEDLVEELVLVEFIEGRSSTNIINKMKKGKKG